MEHIFTNKEKEELRDIIKTYYSDVNRNDITASAKNIIWKGITETYNDSPHTSFIATQKQLRRLWRQLKQKHKTNTSNKNANSKRSIYGNPVQSYTTKNNLENIQNTNNIPNLNFNNNQEEQRKLKKYHMEMKILREQLREAKAKADLAKLVFKRQLNYELDDTIKLTNK